MTAPTMSDQLTVLQLLGHGRGVDFVAVCARMSIKTVRAIALDHGVIDDPDDDIEPGEAKRAAAALAQRADNPLPTREPDPARPPITPATMRIPPRPAPSPRPAAVSPVGGGTGPTTPAVPAHSPGAGPAGTTSAGGVNATPQPQDLAAEGTMAGHDGPLSDVGDPDAPGPSHASATGGTQEMHADLTSDGPNVRNGPDPLHDEPGELRSVPIDLIQPDPLNPRADVGDVTELAESIRTAGLFQPIVVQRTHDGTLRIIAGHRRLAALHHLGRARAQVIIRPAMRDDQALAAMLIENGQRKDLDPIDEARGLSALKASSGGTDATVAALIGRSQAHVSGRLALLALTDDEQAEVRAKRMTLTEATATARKRTGRTGTKGVDRGWHLGPQHPLAQRAKSRCHSLDHSSARTVGGMACGACWEHLIRADERIRIEQEGTTP